MIFSTEGERIHVSFSPSRDGSRCLLDNRTGYHPVHTNREPIRRFRTTGNVKLKYCAVALPVHMS
jgi:hypothetical protein